ncbi:MAG TPA: caspase family protein [Thermoanaerobaculia bacterium]
MKSVAIGLGLVAGMAGTALLCTQPRVERSVGPAQLASLTPQEPPKFLREESTALFVGVRTFRHDEALTVPFAVDDAIDLAYRFALDQRVGLIPPRGVVLALSGSPQKDDSKRRLQELKEAGVRIENATSGDILNLLREQVARTGKRGLFVLSLATHGFQHDGDPYVLGSTSAFGAPETSLRTAALIDIAAQAPRSLLFIDACRERIIPSRGANPDPAAMAPHIKGMARVRGQVIFYAAAPGQYAYDDEVRQNGVFTKAVLDGLDCEASAPNGAVVVETLHPYVDREVRRWIQKNQNKTVNPATQISMEGETRKMTLSRCWLPPGPRIRVSFDDSVVSAYSETGTPLWRHDVGESVTSAEAADLDADAFYEVVAGLRNQLVVLDRDGKRRWTHPGHGATLRTFTTGDLFEKKTANVVAVWYDGHSSRLTVLDRYGREHSSFSYPGELLHVAIGRPTNMHAPKIVVTTRDGILALHPRKLANGTPLWHLRTGETIRDLRIADVNHDSRRDIVVTTSGGTNWFTFDGKVVRGEGAWKEVAIRRKAAAR